MEPFPHVPATETYISRRRPVHGHGINDADYVVEPTINGRQLHCPFYSKWTGMLERVYSHKLHNRRPNYAGAVLFRGWHSFMEFRGWMIAQDWKENHLDKDILVPGNKTYSPDFCVFVPCHINTLLNQKLSVRGRYPTGVTVEKRTGRFRAQCSDLKESSDRGYIGVYDTISEAELAYLTVKKGIIEKYAQEQGDRRVRGALNLYANNLIKNRG